MVKGRAFQAEVLSGSSLLLTKTANQKNGGTYFGHSWSFRYRILGWHNGDYLSTDGLAISPHENHPIPDENTPWLGAKTTTILASRAESTAEAGALYYLDSLKKGRTVDRPFRSESSGNDKRTFKKILTEAKTHLEAKGWFANALKLANPVELREADVNQASSSLLSRGLVERIKVGPPWGRRWIYKITPSAYPPGFVETETAEERRELV